MPKIGEHEKKRRKAHKAYKAVKEQYELLVNEIESDFVDSSETKLGRLPVPIGEKYDRAKREFNDAINALNHYEGLVGVKLSTVSDIKKLGSSVADPDVKPTGRPKNDELAKLDADIRHYQRQIKRVESEPVTTEEEAGGHGKNGRPKLSTEARLHSYRTKIQKAEDEIALIEMKLKAVPKAERNLKKARDRLRFAKIDYKKAVDPEEQKQLASDIALHESTVEYRILALKDMKNNGVGDLIDRMNDIMDELVMHEKGSAGHNQLLAEYDELEAELEAKEML